MEVVRGISCRLVLADAFVAGRALLGTAIAGLKSEYRCEDPTRVVWVWVFYLIFSFCIHRIIVLFML